MILSVIIPTRNETRNIQACIQEVKWAQDAGLIEIIVVDNYSTDDTVALAEKAGGRVVSKGNERSAQRNFGGLHEAQGVYIMYVDADMLVHRATLEEIIGLLQQPEPPDALFVREYVGGDGFWARVRRFERSFYDTTCIDGLRVIRRELFAAVGGFDEKLFAGEDWDLDRRILQKTTRWALTRHFLTHNEAAFTLFGHMRKKNYYASNFGAYCEKWNHDETIRKQFGWTYRLFVVFFENRKWRQALRRPDLLLAIWFYKVMVGLIFWWGVRQSKKCQSE